MQGIQDKIDTEREDIHRMTIWELRAMARKLKMEFKPMAVQITKAKRGVVIAYIEILKEMIEKYNDKHIAAHSSKPKGRLIKTDHQVIDDCELIVPRTPFKRHGDPYLKTKNILVYQDEDNL